MSAVNIFESKGLLSRVRHSLLSQNPNHSLETLAPLHAKNLNWHHYTAIEKFVCSNSKFIYNENEKMELVENK